MERILHAAIDLLRNYALKFGVVGIVAYIVDVAVFNALSLGLLGSGTPWASPIVARTIAFIVSTLVAWIGNRYWTFSSSRRSDTARELFEFILVAVAGMGIVLACLYVSHYLLGYTSLLADNISSNVIGFVLATAFRFLAYRYWVYGENRSGRIRTAPEPRDTNVS
ncbi:GtrA family protein [Leifsonia sp. 2MCAF36]